LFVKGDIGAKGNVIVEEAVVANLGCNPDPLTIPITITVPGPFEESLGAAATSAVDQSKTALELVVEDVAIATDYGMKVTNFAFPSTESDIYRAEAFQILAPRWHELLNNTATWEENEVEHDILAKGSKPYPGLTAYDRKDTIINPVITDGEVNKQESGLDDYPVNLES